MKKFLLLGFLFILVSCSNTQTVVRDSIIEKVNKEEGTITVDCVQSKVDDITTRFKEGQKVKVWFSIPKGDETVWECGKNKIKKVEIIEVGS